MLTIIITWFNNIKGNANPYKQLQNRKKEATHGITLIRELFHHLPELQLNINNKVLYFIVSCWPTRAFYDYCII